METNMNLLTTDEVAELTGLTANWLAIMRMKRIGHSFVKLGRAVRYRPEEIEAWSYNHLVATENVES
jgi:predicted DNA-binding transcriptional regulator AlpA